MGRQKLEGKNQKIDSYVFCILFFVLCALAVHAYADEGKDSNGLLTPEIIILGQGDHVLSEELNADSSDFCSDTKIRRPINLSVDVRERNIALCIEGIVDLFSVNAILEATEDKYKLKDRQKPSLYIPFASDAIAVKAVERKLALFTGRMNKSFSIWLKRSGRYIGMIKDIFREKGLPEELAFLALIESGFDSHAISRAGAVGLWQFMPATAKKYGLIIDWWRDDRKDPVISTIAAAAYLRDLYELFGSWQLAIAAYNGGQGRVSTALRRTGADDLWPLLSATSFLPRETRDFVPRFIAAKIIATAPEDHGFYGISYHKPLKYDEVSTTSPLDIAIIAKSAMTTVNEIRRLNPSLKRWSTPPNVSNYTFRIPKGSKAIFEKNLAKIPTENRFSIDIHKVKKGDTLTRIANKAGVSLRTILSLNSMTGKEILRIDDIIKIPSMGKL
ncbi:transglycosylase SLT domain-containing protein [Thermodesulfovibrionales bacterium]|nr:transglycosylase SLT domain-containing protein [Thermodesulfovibrionales bacterium]